MTLCFGDWHLVLSKLFIISYITLCSHMDQSLKSLISIIFCQPSAVMMVEWEKSRGKKNLVWINSGLYLLLWLRGKSYCVLLSSINQIAIIVESERDRFFAVERTNFPHMTWRLEPLSMNEKTDWAQFKLSLSSWCNKNWCLSTRQTGQSQRKMISIINSEHQKVVSSLSVSVFVCDLYK